MKFVTIGDAKYFETIEFSVFQAFGIYPGSIFLIYDWGFESWQKKKLRSMAGVTLVNWQKRFLTADRFIPPAVTWKDRIRKYILRHPDFRIDPARLNREFMLNEKCYCFLDAIHRIDGSFLFLDGDAFLVSPISEITDADIVVTLRPIHEIKAARQRGDRHDINSGVIYFGKDRHKNLSFLIEWIKEMHLMALKRESLSEQNGLSELIIKNDPDAYSRQQGVIEIQINDMTIRCRIVPTVNYNYNAVEDGFDPRINKILHLKKGRFSEMDFNALKQQIVSNRK